VLLGEQQQVGSAVGVHVAAGQRVVVREAVVEGPLLRRGPAVGAEVGLEHELLGIAVVREVGPAVAVEVGDDHRGDALLGGDGFHTEPGLGRQLVDVAATDLGGGGGGVGLAGAVVEEGDLGTAVVDHDDVVQPVAVDVRDVEEPDAEIEREDLGAAETEPVGGRIGPDD